MVKNIIEQVIVPESPRTISGEQIHVSVPLATTSNAGIASFYKEQFAVIHGVVKIKSDYITSILTGNEIKQTIHNETTDKFVHSPDNLEESAYLLLSGVLTFKEDRDEVYRKIPIDYDNKPKTIAVRDNAGRLEVAEPYGDDDAVNKKYAKDHFVPNPSELSGLSSNDNLYSGCSVTLKKSDGNYVNVTAKYGSDGFTIPLRAFDGTICVETPSYDTEAANKQYVDAADITKISVSPSEIGVDGKYTITLERGDKTSLTAEIDLPLEAIKVANIDDYVTDDGKHMLRVTYADGKTLNIELDELFKGLISEEEVKAIVTTETKSKVDKITPPQMNTQYVYCTVNTYGGGISHSLYPIQGQPTAYTVAVREANGTLKVGTATDDTHAVTFKQFKDATEDLMPKPSAIKEKNYGDGIIPSQTVAGLTRYYVVRTNTEVVNDARYSIPLRDVNGCVNTCEPVTEFNAVNKGYFDKATAPITKIADHEKRIENLESTLLTFIDDTETAYEKDVPIGVGENAVLSSIRGAMQPKNYLDPDLVAYSGFSGYSTVYEDGTILIDGTVSDEYQATVTISGLENGTYFYKVYGEPSWGFDRVIDKIFESEQIQVTNGTITRSVQIVSYEGDVSEAYVFFEGKIMLSKTETEQPYVPFGVEKHGKVTAVESYNSSLIDDVAIFKELGWVKQPNGYWFGSSASKLIFENTEQVSGKLTISYMGKTLTANGISNSVFTMWIMYTDGTKDYGCNITDKSLDYASRIFTTDADKTVSTISIAHGISGTFEIKDFRIDWGTEVDEKVIDSFEIPQEIQAINGYGKDGFVLDLESKTTEYEGETTDVSQYLTGYDKFKTLKVEGGGKVRFVNENGLAVPSEITYVKAKE